MANKRILELAKELSVTVAEVQRAAVNCSVAVSGPTSLLNDEDTAKIKASLKSRDKSSSPGGKTLTLNRPMVAGQARAGGGSVDGRGRTVQVAVRRHHKPGQPAPAKPTTQTSTKEANVKPSTKPIAKPLASKLSPAQRAAQAIESKKLEVSKAKQTKVEPRRESRPARTPSDARRPSPDARRTSPDARRTPSDRGGRHTTNSGPRTTIRRGLTPAQIAASKAPRSSIKQIEAKISSERAERRKDRASRPAGARGGAPRAGGNVPGGPRRSPSVAVAPQPNAPPAEGQRRRPAFGGGPG
ncbi:MAG: hypothetical protein R8K54_08855 [Mariprofundaceae bacterium]